MFHLKDVINLANMARPKKIIVDEVEETPEVEESSTPVLSVEEEMVRNQRAIEANNARK